MPTRANGGLTKSTMGLLAPLARRAFTIKKVANKYGKMATAVGMDDLAPSTKLL